MNEITDHAIEAHVATVLAEGGERIHKEYRFGPYRAAIVWLGNQWHLIIRPHQRAEGAWNVGIPRSEIHRYLRPDGHPEGEAFFKAAQWVGDMGRPCTKDEIHRVVDILVHCWPDFFNVPQPGAMVAPDPIVEVAIAAGDKPAREVSL